MLLSRGIPKRWIETEIICPKCTSHMILGRTWTDVSLWCKSCRHPMAINEVVHLMSEEMENFLEQIYCDRM